MFQAFAHHAGQILGPVASVGLWALAPFLLLPLLILILGQTAQAVALPATQLIESVSAFAERIAQILLLILLLAVFATVVMRYIFGWSANWLQEGALFAHGISFLLAAPAALGREAHVRVDVLLSRFSRKGKAWVDVVAFYLFLTPLTLAIVSVADRFLGLSWSMAERSPETDGLPGWFLVKTFIPVFAVLLLAQGVAWASRAACTIRDIAPAPPRFMPERERPA
jgi:TRAP-type mannitol/chloroaromatic compound transport system permease small subunit